MRVVFLYRFDNPLFHFKYFPDRFSLAIAEFKHDFPVRLQERSSLRRDQTVKLQAIRAAVEREPRVEIADLRLERRNLRGRDVRRIADDQVESRGSRYSGKAVAGQEFDQLGNIVPRGIFFGQRQRLG